ncbi:hypothetical protein M427DRAFT_148899 [Gonapodya prolifera JEL478]|uniref:Kinase-like protein n=1 Tax=Gonapodya prolifera (strain JEL478) TaxID=1344416 RepID=A0A139A0L4_GONPJ|nr:hypothetical protein M427DRAFT_148899 [Gonapodya prolifera JEL478]|eukprot:KXS10309.1 hypothetical protein M427DRAFT_148899 [Gonapodya prolifera JEL478]
MLGPSPAELDTNPAHPDAGDGVSTAPTKRPSDWEIPESEIAFCNRLAAGGYGEVFLGEWQSLPVAVKRLFGAALTADLKKEFMDEVSVWKSLRHPHVSLLLGACVESQSPFMVSEFMANGEFSESACGVRLGSVCWAERFGLTKGDVTKYTAVNALGPARKVQLMRDIARGMLYLHSRDIVHSDLKGLNVLVSSSGQGLITDFGFARVRSGMALVDLPGTAIFMPPERFLTGVSDKKGDVYAFGVTCYQVRGGLRFMWTSFRSYVVSPKPQKIWTNNKPFSGGASGDELYSLIVNKGYRPDQVKPFVGAPPELVTMVRMCWNDDPDLRPEFSELVEKLSDILWVLGSLSCEPLVSWLTCHSSQSAAMDTSDPSNNAISELGANAYDVSQSKAALSSGPSSVSASTSTIMTSSSFAIPKLAATGSALVPPEEIEMLYAASTTFSVSTSVAKLGAALWGLLAVPLGVPTTPTAVPLRRVAIRVNIVDCIASVVLSQTYFNDGSSVIEAAYRFPVQEGAAVNGFEVDIDGKTIKGVCRERGVAAKQYNEAFSAGKRAALFQGQEDNSNVFQVLVGNISPGQSVTVRITYVHECPSNLQLDELRFNLPATALSKSSGATPASSPGESGSGMGYKMTIEVDVQATGGPVSLVDSTSHIVDVAIDIENPKHATVKMEQNSVFLDRDFVLVVKSSSLDKPRSALERNLRTGTKCAMLTFVPKFNIKEMPTELLILVDRSGSMLPVIETARSALACLLSSLPATTIFNVIGFGSAFAHLFPTSVPSTEENLNLAQERVVSNLGADMGGCNLLSVLEAVTTRPVLEGRQRSVVILTRGFLWDGRKILKLVAKASHKSSTRFFTLAVGDGVWGFLLKGIARAGMGVSESISNPDDQISRIEKILKIVQSPFVRNVKVIWRDPNLTTSMNINQSSLFQENSDSSEMSIQCAPYHSPPLYPGQRYISYAMMDSTVPDPTVIQISGVGPDGPMELKVDLPPENILAESINPLLHVMAARRLVQDIEENMSWLNVEPGEEIPVSRAKTAIVSLGTTHGIATRYTSYVAIKTDDIPVQTKADFRVEVPSDLNNYDAKPSDFVPSNQSGEGDLPGGGLFDDDDFENFDQSDGENEVNNS